MGADADVTLVQRVDVMNWSPTPTRPAEADRLDIARLMEQMPGGKRPQLRPCRATWMDTRGDIQDTRFLIPAHAVFEAAFCAFARGTLIDTDTGPTAIEDLLPGDKVLTSDGTGQAVTWIGTTTLVPVDPSARLRSVPLYRVMTDAFGLARPISPMIAGPSARVPGRSGQGLCSLAAFEDGVQVARITPPSPVEMFHLCLKDHALIRVGGLDFETYHPGHGALSEMRPAMRDLFLKLFPQIDHVADFGLMVQPREPEPPTEDASAA